MTNSNVQSVCFGRLAQRERRCLTSTRPGVQIPHRPPLTQRPPAMGVFFVPGEASLDLNPARRSRCARKAVRGTRHSPHGLAWIMLLLRRGAIRLSRARQFGSASFSASLLLALRSTWGFVQAALGITLSEKRRENAQIDDRGRFGLPERAKRRNTDLS